MVEHLEQPMVARFIAANEHRDYKIYTSSMDAALKDKALSIFPHFGFLRNGAIIVDAGSGTGTLAELAAKEFRAATVYGLDISHELREIAEGNRALIHLVFGDASKQVLPSNTVDVKYFSTSGHEIASIDPDAMARAVQNSWNELKPNGKLIIRDFAKPERTEPIYMKILSHVGVDDVYEAAVQGVIDYNKLSARTLFLRFHAEFRGGNAFSFERAHVGGQEYFLIDPEWAYEFYLRKDYTANWRQEIKEKYSYWTPSQAKAVFEEAGFMDVRVIPDPNEYILRNRLIGKIALFEMDTQGKLIELPFPPTHMVIEGTKPMTKKSAASLLSVEKIHTADYEERKKTIVFDTENNAVIIGGTVFPISEAHERIKGSKKDIYWLKDEPPRVLKVVRQDGYNDHSIFKAMYQCITREHILEEAHIPHMRTLEVDPAGPPYRYLIQEAIPETAISAADLITANSLTENDIAQMASYVNSFETQKTWQLDTNPFNWYRQITASGETVMTYVDGKIYRYDEAWEFRRIGLLQWLDPSYTRNISVRSASIPKSAEYDRLRKEWIQRKDDQSTWWKKYLNPLIQPREVG